MQSLYVVHSQILSLSDRPFPTITSLRKIWHSIFGSENCFSINEMCVKTRDRMDYDPAVQSEKFYFKEIVSSPPLNSKPFIKGFGPVVFDTHNFRFYKGSELALTELTIGGGKLLKKLKNSADKININNIDNLSRGIDIWNVATSYPEVKRHEQPYYFDIFFLRDLFKKGLSKGVFGCDFTRKDQRMNFLYFEIGRPLYFRINKREDLDADGRIFLHLYPSGYMVLYFAICLRWKSELSKEEIKRLLIETKPWNDKKSLASKSRWGSFTLHELYNKTLTAIDSSLFIKPSDSVVKGRWFSFALRTYDSDWDGSFVDNYLFDRYKEEDSRLFNINRQRGGNTYKFEYHSSLDYFSISNRWAISGSQEKSNRHRRLRLFWKFIQITEFVLLKMQIYENYKSILRSETLELTTLRLNSIQKLTNEQIGKLSVFDGKIPSFLAEMDKQVKLLDPFYRKVYSEISTQLGFDRERQTILLDLQKWEDEVAQWEHGLITYWKKIVAPIRSFLSG